MEALRDRYYSDDLTPTARNRKLAKQVGTTLSQVQRIIRKDLGVSIDMLDDLSRAFDCTPTDLLTPYFAEKFREAQSTEKLLEGRTRPRRPL